MKKILTLVMIAFLAVTTSSCTKDETTSEQTTTPVATDGFRWTDSSGSTIQTVNNPYVNGQFNSIFAVRSGATIYEINLTSLAVGTYTLGGSSLNSLFYNSTGSLSTSFSPNSGSVVITANANNKLTGTFTATGTGGGVTSVSGSFTNIVINP